MSCRCTNIVAVAVASCVFLIIADTAASQYPADAANRTRHTIRRRLLQRRAAGVASSQRDECVREKRPSTDLLRLLPSPANADFHRHDGRCAYRYKQLNAAWAGCIAEPLCVGVVRDNGLACGGRQASHPFELRGGGASRGASTNAWVCGPRLRAVEQAEAEARPPPQVPPEGFLYVLHGGCAVRDYGCNHVLEMATSVASIRALPPPRRPIAVLSDGGIPAVWLRSRLGVDYVAALSVSGGEAIDDDPRVKKLRAYDQSPFAKTASPSAASDHRPDHSATPGRVGVGLPRRRHTRPLSRRLAALHPAGRLRPRRRLRVLPRPLLFGEAVRPVGALAWVGDADGRDGVPPQRAGGRLLGGDAQGVPREGGRLLAPAFFGRAGRGDAGPRTDGRALPSTSALLQRAPLHRAAGRQGLRRACLPRQGALAARRRRRRSQRGQAGHARAAGALPHGAGLGQGGARRGATRRDGAPECRLARGRAMSH
mmetsp:Transcript_31582/g.94129  ORF Transcript_31582/g.94129 Transcript_31582/m.94129 type:complete len:484 (-) Transcript_31582:21-1472(-)